MKKIALGCVALVWAGLVGAAELSVDFTFSAADVELTAAGEYTAIGLADGSGVVDEVGAPSIPAKFANILLPSGAQNVRISASGDWTLLAEGLAPYPAQPRRPKSFEKPAFVPANDRYASAAAWPAETATYQGDHDMQGYRFVSVRVNPLAYVGAEKKLYLRESVTVTVTYDAAPAAKGIFPRQKSAFDPLVRSLVVNPAAAKAFAPAVKTAVPRAAAEYLIITRASLTNAFKALQTSRASRFTTDMLTVESITNTYSGTDAQAKIRACIQDYVSNNATAYVVLGGDNTIVPARGCWVDVDGETETAMPTDLYYSGLNGNWNSDGDANYGETTDGVDMAWDVVVGRIPVRTTTHANAYIDKLLAFEANPNRFDGKILLGGMEAWDTYTGSSRPSDNCTNSDHHADFRYAAHTSVSDSEMWDRRLYRDGILPYWTGSNQIAIFCDTLTTWDTTFGSGNYSQTASNLKSKFNQGWYHMFFSGHGDTALWGLESGSFGTSDASSMTNLIVFTYTDACLTGGFDDGEPSLSEAFLRNAAGGALIYLGCSRYGWGSPDASPASNTSDGGPSTVYGYKFYQRLHETTGRTVGTAFAMHKADMISLSGTDDCERWIQFGMNLQGDPVLSLEPLGDQPPALQPVPAQSVTVSQALSFTVTATDGDGDTVRLTASGLPSGATFAGATGTVSVSSAFNWTPAATGSYSVTFYAGDKDGTNSTIASIAVNPRAKPVITTTPSGASVSTVVGNPFTLTVQAAEADGDTVTITNLTLPAWATFKATNGVAPLQSVMSGTPAATGTYSAIFRASDADGAATSTVQIVVTEAPSVIDISGYKVTQVDSTLNFTLPADTFIPVNGYVVIGRNATKDAFEAAWGVTLGSEVTYLNSGDKMPQLNGSEQYSLYNAASGLIEGPTPTDIEPKSNSVQRKSAQSNATATASWTVVAMASGTPGTGGSGNGTGGLVISEYSDASSWYNEFVELYYDGVAGSQPAQAPAISVVGGTNQSVTVSSPISFNVTATDPEGNSVALSASSKPAGATFTAVSGASPQSSTFSWTPASAGSYEVVFVATDGVDGMGTTQRVAIAVLSAVGAPPAISVTGGTNQYVTVNRALTFTVTATDPEDNDVILIDDAKPAGATFGGVEGPSPQSCVLSWTPAVAGSYEAIFVAADGYDGAEATQRVAITVTSSGGGNAPDLFFSEYVEGSGTNKYLEIFNGTGASVDLSNYKVLQFNNGASTPGSYVLNLSGSLANGATYVIENSHEGLGVTANLSTNSAVMGFNGDDAIALTNTLAGRYADIFGRIGTDPGTAWTDGSHSTVDQTLVRKSSVTNGIMTNPGSGFPTLASEWNLYTKNTVSYLGSHTFDGGGAAAPDSQPVEFVQMPTNGTCLSIGIPSTAGIVYQLQYVTNLVDVPLVWHTVISEEGTGAEITLQDGETGAQRFYRIVQP